MIEWMKYKAIRNFLRGVIGGWIYFAHAYVCLYADVCIYISIEFCEIRLFHRIDLKNKISSKTMLYFLNGTRNYWNFSLFHYFIPSYCMMDNVTSSVSFVLFQLSHKKYKVCTDELPLMVYNIFSTLYH